MKTAQHFLPAPFTRVYSQTLLPDGSLRSLSREELAVYRADTLGNRSMVCLGLYYMQADGHHTAAALAQGYGDLWQPAGEFGERLRLEQLGDGKYFVYLLNTPKDDFEFKTSNLATAQLIFRQFREARLKLFSETT